VVHRHRARRLRPARRVSHSGSPGPSARPQGFTDAVAGTRICV